MMTWFTPSWQRFFAQAASSADRSPALSPLVPLVSVPAHPWRGNAPRWDRAAISGAPGAAPPRWPRLPEDQRPIPPEPSRRTLELAWLTWQMPEGLREPAQAQLRQTLARRARWGVPLSPPRKPLATTRFGVQGEDLWPTGAQRLGKALRAEVRESVRVVEGSQPHLERNRLLAMRGARLGELCAELEQRGLDALAELRAGLARL